MALAFPTTPDWAALVGQYQLHPGAQPGVTGQRPVLSDGRLRQLLRGQRGAAVVRMLGSLFSLCSHAHQRTAHLALTAALGQPQDLNSANPPVTLWLETARDHLRSLALDWPQRLPESAATAPDLQWLRGCPLSLAGALAVTDEVAAWEQLKQLRVWLEEHILGQSIKHWLEENKSPEALFIWCQIHAEHLPPARFLSLWHPFASRLQIPARCLQLLHPEPDRQNCQLTALAQSMQQVPNFMQAPTWHGQCAENGPWTRLRQSQHDEIVPQNAWWRMSARWLELLTLAAANPEDSAKTMLSSGALRLAQGQALGWCEMARGLLLHWVQVDAQGAVLDYRVLAPTEWNFHPEGALAQAVAAMAPTDLLPAALLAAAFDPCVSCRVFGATVTL
jgi:hypothetical protein